MILHGIQFSDKPCMSCGWHHQVDAFKPKQSVRILTCSFVLGNTAFNQRDFTGEIGTVVEWSCYGGPVRVRVQFPDGVRGSFEPCELEHV